MYSNYMEMFTTFPSGVLATILVLLLFCIFLYSLRANRQSISVYKLPPSPSKLPIIGNLHHLIGKSRHEALWKLSREYGPIMLLHIGSKPFLVISSPTLAKEILKTQDHKFCSRPINQACKQITYNFSDVAFAPQSDRRREMRKILVSAYLGSKKVKLFNDVLAIEIDKMVHSLSLHPSNTLVDLNKIILATISGVVCRVGFGTNYREEPIKGLSWENMLQDSVELLDGSLVDSFPWLGQIIDHFSGWNARLEKNCNDIDTYFEMTINEHENRTIQEISDDHDKDFLQTIIELSSIQNASNYRLTKNEVKGHLVDVFTGGIDTTVVTTVWAMSELARNTRVMQKLQNEIRNCLGRKQKAHELDLTKMTYLKMVVKETLRLHPPAPLLIPHESLCHSQVGGYDIFPGTTVFINGWGIARDPTIWGDNAADFYPERFEKLDIDYGGGDFYLIPFGGGRRSCPAVNSAPTTVESVIANLLYWFNWEVPTEVKKEDLNMQEDGSFIVQKKLPLRLMATKHNWDD